MWYIHLTTGHIRDGVHGDFSIGDIAVFAIEFDDNFVASKDNMVGCILQNSSAYKYEVSCKSIYANSGVWVIDFGLLAYAVGDRDGSYPPNDRYSTGNYFNGMTPLFIDWNDYEEWISDMPQVPSLYYTWKIEGILQMSCSSLQWEEVGTTSLHNINLTSSYLVEYSYLLCGDVLDVGRKRKRKYGASIG